MSAGRNGTRATGKELMQINREGIGFPLASGADALC